MDLRQIENIIAIEQEQSISRAAEKLFLTHFADCGGNGGGQRGTSRVRLKDGRVKAGKGAWDATL